MLDGLIVDGMSLKTIQLLIKNRKASAKKQKDIVILEKKINATEETNLNDVKGIGASTIQTLLSHGIKTQEDLKKISPDKIKEIIKSPVVLKAINNI